SAKRLRPRVVAFVRLAVIGLAVAAVTAFVFLRRREVARVEGERAALLAAVRAQSASLRPDEKNALARVETWLARLSSGYEGDLLTENLRVADVATRPSVYVRGPLGAFANPAAIAPAAAASAKDAFLLCLVAPPASRAEKVMLGKVRTAYAGAELHT